VNLEAVRESDWDTINLRLPCGLTVGEVIEADDFADMAEG
jgi:hypothetical protein